YVPVAADLREEPADPRAELDALRVELDPRTELRRPALRVFERLLLDVPLQIPKRIVQRAGAVSPASSSLSGETWTGPAVRQHRADLLAGRRIVGAVAGRRYRLSLVGRRR